MAGPEEIERPSGGNGKTATLKPPAAKPASKTHAKSGKKTKSHGISKAGAKLLSWNTAGKTAKWIGYGASGFWMANLGYRVAKGSSFKNAAKAAFGFSPIEVE